MKLPSPALSPKLACALLAAAAIPIAAHAQSTTFPLDGTEGLSTFAETINGITLTLTNPNNGDFVDEGTTTSGTSSGIYLTNGQGLGTTSFNLSFDPGVVVTSYTVNQDFGATAGTFTLSGPNSASSTGNDLSTAGSHNVEGTFTIAANDLGTFVDSIPDGEYADLDSITVTVVPEPATWALLAMGGLAAGLAARRRRQLPAEAA